MKRIVILLQPKFKDVVRAGLVMSRVQYSMFTDICTGDVRLSLPRSKGIHFLAELRRASIPFELI